jgi:hypothetical protein
MNLPIKLGFNQAGQAIKKACYSTKLARVCKSRDSLPIGHIEPPRLTIDTHNHNLASALDETVIR